jgi:hypothetical protein
MDRLRDDLDSDVSDATENTELTLMSQQKQLASKFTGLQ